MSLAHERVQVREVRVVNPEGVHARPVMRFVDVASLFQSTVTVTNVTRGNEDLDGKSAMHLMLLDAPCGSVLRIRAEGDDARAAVETLARLVERGFRAEPA